jgi:hypothetical protein
VRLNVHSSFVPRQDDFNSAWDAFEGSQTQKLTKTMRTAIGLAIDEVTVESPVYARLSYNVYGALRMLAARKFNLSCLQYGPTKVAIWNYFKVQEQVEGTTLYIDPMPSEYLEWIWEIPVSPDTISVGYVAPGAAVKAKRDRRKSLEDVFQEQLMKFSRFVPLLEQAVPGAVHVTSFQCRVYTESAGPNWLTAGEATSLVDPMTANGVTAALRHAAEAAALVLKFRARGELPWHARKAYSSRIVQTAKFFNEGIETIIYEPVVRSRIGLATTGTVYYVSRMEHERSLCASKPGRIVVHIPVRCNAGILSDCSIDPLLVVQHAEA